MSINRVGDAEPSLFQKPSLLLCLDLLFRSPTDSSGVTPGISTCKSEKCEFRKLTSTWKTVFMTNIYG